MEPWARAARAWHKRLTESGADLPFFPSPAGSLALPLRLRRRGARGSLWRRLGRRGRCAERAVSVVGTGAVTHPAQAYSPLHLGLCPPGPRRRGLGCSPPDRPRPSQTLWSWPSRMSLLKPASKLPSLRATQYKASSWMRRSTRRTSFKVGLHMRSGCRFHMRRRNIYFNDSYVAKEASCKCACATALTLRTSRSASWSSTGVRCQSSVC